jgi:hypothetical protein
MRGLAWTLVVFGLILIGVSPLYAVFETRIEQQAWLNIQRRSLGQAGLPAPRGMSPWPGIYTGAGITAFGILLLAIIRRQDSEREILIEIRDALRKREGSESPTDRFLSGRLNPPV